MPVASQSSARRGLVVSLVTTALAIALQSDPSAQTGIPGPPGTPVISGFGEDVTITWTPPVAGGAATSYTVIARQVAGGPILGGLAVGNVLTTSVRAPSGTYHVTVRAANASGPGPESVGVTFNVPIPAPTPGPPTGLAVGVLGDQATFTWTPPTTGGTPTGYALFAALTSGGAPIGSLLFGAPANRLVVNAIPPGLYYVRLAALNTGGAGEMSNEVTVSVAGAQPPGPPTLSPAVVSAGQVTLAWTAPTTGGAAASYLVVASAIPGGPSIASLPVSGLGITVPAPRGTYYVRVHGVNALGAGLPSNEIRVDVP